MSNWIVPLVAVACSVPFVVLAVRASGSRDLAVAYARRRPRQALLVCSGIVVATAMFVSAVLVGDSLRASIRQSVTEQLGPIDQEVVRPGTDPAPIDAAITHATAGQNVKTLPMVASITTVRGRDFIARVAQAQVVEVDFAAAQRFAGGPGPSGMVGNTPTGDTAVMSADLSDALAVAETHRVTVYAFGQSRTFTISQTLPRRGIAGIRTPLSPAGSLSYNLFVPLGTLESMRAASSNADPGQATPEAVVAVAHAQSASAANAVQSAARVVGADVRPVRQQTLDDADRRSRSITDLFRSFAFFGAFAGFALLVLALGALGRDRVRSTAALRAHGLSRRGVVGALTLEGWFYALVGTAFGVLFGWGLGEMVVVIARHVFEDGNAPNVELAFSARLSSFVDAAAVVFLLALATILTTAVIASRRNVVSAMRGISKPFRLSPPLRRGIGAALALAGVVLLVVGLARPAGVAAIAGVPLLAIGGVLFAGEPAYRRWVIGVVGGAVLVWSLVLVDLVPKAWTTLSGSLIVVEGLVLTSALLGILATQLERPRLGRSSHRRRATALASMYARQPSWRTILVAATYATLLFMVTVLITVRGLYERDTNNLAHRMGGESSLEVTSNAAAPVSEADVARLPGVVGVKAATAIPAQLTTAGASQTRDVTAVGIDDSWVNSSSPPLASSAATTADPYAVVVHDPSRVLVGADLYADAQSGFPRGVPHVGDHIQVFVPATGASRTLTVAGIVEAARYDGADHVYVARSVVDDLLGKPAVPNLLFVDTESSTNPSVLAAIIDGTHLENGTYARAFVRLAHDSNIAQAQFLDISAGYAAVGLVAAIIAIGIVMIDRVRERRRQLASLRALGASSALVRRSVRIEAALIAFTGMLSGVVCGVVLTWRFDRINAFTAARGVYVPWLPLAVAVVAVLIASVGAATAAARGMSRLQPARVLPAEP